MDIISHIQEMLAKGTVSAYIALGIAGVCGVLMLLGALAGIRRGLMRQGVRFLTIIASVAISFFAATGITNGVLGFFEGKTLVDAIVQIGGGAMLEEMEPIVLAILNGISPAAVQQVLALPFALFVAPIVFVLVFLVVSLLMGIVHKIISGACGFTKRKNNALTRLLGFVLGAFQGIIVTAVVLVPISGIFGMVSNTVAQIERLDDATVTASTADPGNDASDELDMSAVLDMYDEFLRDAVESPVLKLTNTLGGELLSKQISTVKIAGKRQDARLTIPSLVEIAVDAMSLADLDVENLTQEDKNTITGLIDKLMDEPLTSTIIVESFKAVASAVADEDADILGELDLEAPLDDIIIAAVSVYTNSTVETVKSDLVTMCEVLFIVADSDLIANAEDIDPIELIIAPDDENLVVRILEVVADNPNFNGIVLNSFDALAEAIENEELELPEEMASFMFAIDPVIAHFADMESLDGIVADVKTLLAVMRDLEGAGVFEEDSELALEDFIFAEEGETPLINVMLGRFVDNPALDTMIMEVISGAAEAIKNGDIDEIPEEMDEYMFLVAPVLDHFGEMSSVSFIIADIDTIIDIYVVIDESGITSDNYNEDDLLDDLLFGEEPLIDAVLDLVDENDALEELIVDIIAGAATAIKDGDLPALEDADIPEDVLNIVMEVIGVIGETDSAETLKADIQVIKDVYALLDGVEFDEDTDYIELLFGADEGEESVLIQALEILANSRFDDAVLSAIQTFASDPAFLEEADEETAEIIKPFLEVFKGEDITLQDIVEDVEAIQDIIILLNDSGAFEEDADVATILFIVADDKDEALIETIVTKLGTTDFRDPLINAYKALSKKDDNGKYLMLDGADALTASLLGPILDEIGRTASYEQVENDIGYIVEVITLLDEAGLLDDSSDIDELEAIFGREGEEDSILVKIITVFEGSRYDDELTNALTETIGDELDHLGDDPTMAVVAKAMFNLLHGLEDLTEVKENINALGDVIVILEVSGDGDMLVLLTKDTAGNTPIHNAIAELSTPELQKFFVEVVTGLAEGVVNNYDGELGDDEIEIDLGELDQSTHAFVVSIMEVLVGINNDPLLTTDAAKVAQIDEDVATIANVIDILEKNDLITSDGIVNINVVTLFTNPAVDAVAGETAIDVILAEFEDNDHLNPVLLALTQSLADDITLINVGAPFDMLVTSVADVFERSTTDSVVADIATVADVFVILVDAGVLEENADAVAILSAKDPVSGKTIVDSIKETLDANENTKPIVTDFTKISLSLMIQGTTGGSAEDGASNFEEIEETYTEAKGELDSVVTDSVIVTDGGTKYSEKSEEEKAEAVENVSGAITEALNNTLKSEDDTTEEPVISEEVAKGMAEYVLENYGDKTLDDLKDEGLYVEVKDENGDVVTNPDGSAKLEISDEAISDVILSYYQAWLAAQQQGAGN